MSPEAYLPFIVSIVGTILAGLFAWFTSRPKAQTDRFSSLIQGYATLNEKLQKEIERLTLVVSSQATKIGELEASEQRLENKINQLIKECMERAGI